MYPRVLSKIRELIRTKQYVMTLHAEEQMDDDDLTIFDVEEAIFTGKIIERQKDKATGEWKYAIKGKSLDRTIVFAVGKIGFTGKFVIITVYAG